MRISLSGHARRRMNERNVSLRDIENVLSSRVRNHPSHRKRTQHGRSLGGRALEVVYTESVKENFHIVTVKVMDR
jgi:hypothetical protein